MLELTNLRTENGKLFEAWKDTKSGTPSYTLEARTGPIHYKKAYRDSDPWQDLDESYCEPGEIKGIGRVLVYPRLPNIVTVFQDRCGYQIQSRSNPDHIAKVELVSIDGQKVTAWQDSAALKTRVKVHPYRVGIWKDFSEASKAKATTMRWKVTELGNSAKDSHPFAFRDQPEAFSTTDIDSLIDRESAKVTIETARTRIDDQSWYWDELIPARAKLVDTDWQVGADANDGHWFENTFYWLNDLNVTIGNNGASCSSFARFVEIGIPKGNTIILAKCVFCCSVSQSYSTCNVKVYHNASDNAVAPVNITEAEALSLSTNYNVWDNLSAWTKDDLYDTPSLISSTQEIVNRVGWSSGNAMMVLLKDNSSSSNARRNFYGYAANPSKAAKLSITWTDPPRPRGTYVPNVSWLSKSLLKRREI